MKRKTKRSVTLLKKERDKRGLPKDKSVPSQSHEESSIEETRGSGVVLKCFFDGNEFGEVLTLRPTDNTFEILREKMNKKFPESKKHKKVFMYFVDKDDQKIKITEDDFREKLACLLNGTAKELRMRKQ